MKYLKRYNESNKLLNSESDDFLRDRLYWLRIEYKELGDEITQINSILTRRLEDSQEKYANNLPDSIYDFNTEQLEWIFDHGHSTTTKKYKISEKYFRELKGVTQGGFNRHTNQVYFNILTDYYYGNLTTKEDAIKSIKFLGDNLKKHNSCVEFSVLYGGESHNTIVRYYSDSHIILGNPYLETVESISEVLEYISESKYDPF